VTAASPTVFVVDDDSSLRRSLARLLEAAGYRAETFAAPADFLAHAGIQGSGCLLLDLQLPGLNGLELQQRLHEAGCLMPIVFLSGQADVPDSVRAMKAGALDFLTKPCRDVDLLAAVASALEMDRRQRRERAEVGVIQEHLASLTPREREVLSHVLSGALNKQIADALGTVEKTIKVHRARVMAKMQAGSVAELVRLAERAGVLPSPPFQQTVARSP